MADINNPVHHVYTKFIKATKDPRDWQFSKISKPVNLPDAVDLRPGCPPVYDQGQLGSCSGNAIAAAIDYSKKKQGHEFMTPSRLFIYYNERVLENTVSQDAGAMLRDGIKTIVHNGVCEESVWPYNIRNFTLKPSDAAYKQAMDNQVLQYFGVDVRVSAVKQALAQNFPVIIGIQIFESFEDRRTAETGIVKMPSPNEQSLGGHAVLVVGYDDAHNHWIVRNSWGPEWGSKGYFYLPYEYMNPNMVSDMWVVQSVE